MHIVVDCRFVHHSGIGRYIRELVPRIMERLAEDGFTLLVSPEERDDIFLGQCERAKLIPLEAGMYSLAEQWEVPRRVPSCDIFWAPHYNAPLLPVRAKKKIVTIHDMAHLVLQEGLSLPKRLYARLFFWNAAHRYDHILTVSDFSRSEILRWEAVPEEKISVHPIAADMVKYRPCGDEDRKRRVLERYGLPGEYILFVGNVKPNKNLRRMLEAYALFRREGTRNTGLVIVGKREGLMTGVMGLDALIRSLGIEDSVHFTGFVEDEDLPVLYSAAACFVFPSLYEGFGLPPLEAMACGCPVIASDAASIPEVCGPGALYADPRNSGDLAARLRELLGNPALAAEMTERGLRRVRRFSWEKAADGIAGLLTSENLSPG